MSGSSFHQIILVTYKIIEKIMLALKFIKSGFITNFIYKKDTIYSTFIYMKMVITITLRIS